MLSNIGLPELLIVLVIALLLFGTRLPKVGRSLGEGIKNFKKGLNTPEESDEETAKPADASHNHQKVIAEEAVPDKLGSQQQQQAHVVDVEHKDVHKS